MIGTGEYTTGLVSGTQSTSDKQLGVVALTLFRPPAPRQDQSIPLHGRGIRPQVPRNPGNTSGTNT
ncbi:hypothetical protein GJ744_011651 [Endocarpon pusillum]|uniref:Uncharacterized protein n=1 Tax=Endocarpon pusillum TaxID=364733 RepID=A0A8H7ACB4_9EURO|nr:hypothetical protein GJ744_011651 [Endocarpon pusillum]